MDIKELVKFQMINQMGAQNHETTPVALFYRVLLMGLMSVIDDIIKSIPRFFEAGKKYCFSYCKTQIKQSIEQPKTLNDLSVQLNTRHFENRFTMTRVYQSDSKSNQAVSEESNGMFDAVLAQISKLTNVPSFQLITRGQVMISYKEKPVQMTKDVFFKVESINMGESGEVTSIKIVLMSNSITAAEIVSYVNDVYQSYLKELKNSIGNRIFYFDQKTKENGPVQPPPTATADAALNHRRMLISSAPKQLSFTMSPFYSNKRLSNIFGEEARLVEKRIRFFMENREWYDEKGIPYQIGFLLSGLAGAGKTSLIKGIANYTKRHIINVNFANITTATQLKNLFYSDRIQVYTDTSMSNTQSYYIPIDQRIYVLEEIDAIGDIVKQRDPNAPQKSTIPDELTLAEILTVMDGTMEIPGRIIIMTTNLPETLDRALVRPGRIDVHVNFGHAKRELIVEMFEAYFEMQFPEASLHRLPDRLLSPAQVGQVLFKHFDTDLDIEALIRDFEEAVGPQAAVKAPVADVAETPVVEALLADVAETPVADVPKDDPDVLKVAPEIPKDSSDKLQLVKEKSEKIQGDLPQEMSNFFAKCQVGSEPFNPLGTKAEVMLSHGVFVSIEKSPMFAPAMDIEPACGDNPDKIYAINEFSNYALIEDQNLMV